MTQDIPSLPTELARPRAPLSPGQTRPAARPGPSLWVRSLRVLREWHRYLGVPLALFVILNALTGLLLGWKKASATLQPPTARGASARLANWRSLEEVGRSAEAALAAHLGGSTPPRLDRMDVRPERGIVKVLFTPGVWEVQVDPATLAVHSVARRHSDWIEALHDGSLFGEPFKQALTSMLALGLIALSVSGVWLWYGPRRLRRERPA